MSNLIQENLAKIKRHIHAAEEHYAREQGSVQLLAASKTKSASLIREAYQAGQKAFGENYLQEALAKMDELRDLEIEWHFIGSIQANKTRKIAENFSWVHSINKEKIAQRLNDQRPAELPPLNVCIEVNISEEPTKSGVLLQYLSQLAVQINKMPNLKLRGLMAIPVATYDSIQQRKSFQQLRLAKEKLNQQGMQLDTLSMGMSNDFGAAIAEGATIVRIGTAIFGKREK